MYHENFWHGTYTEHIHCDTNFHRRSWNVIEIENDPVINLLVVKLVCFIHKVSLCFFVFFLMRHFPATFSPIIYTFTYASTLVFRVAVWLIFLTFFDKTFNFSWFSLLHCCSNNWLAFGTFIDTQWKPNQYTFELQQMNASDIMYERKLIDWNWKSWWKLRGYFWPFEMNNEKVSHRLTHIYDEQFCDNQSENWNQHKIPLLTTQKRLF